MSIDLTDNDLVFITNGGCVENSTLGDQNTPAPFNAEIKEGGGWDMWRKIAAQDPAFGHPDKFCSDPEKSNWMSATVTTLDDKIPPYIQKICKRDPFSGRRRDRRHRDREGLQLAAELDVQPSAPVPRAAQGQTWWAGYTACSPTSPGNYVKKPMRECTGKEICMEWLYHMGVPESEIPGAGRAQRQHRALHDALHQPRSSCRARRATVRTLYRRAA